MHYLTLTSVIELPFLRMHAYITFNMNLESHVQQAEPACVFNLPGTHISTCLVEPPDFVPWSLVSLTIVGIKRYVCIAYRGVVNQLDSIDCKISTPSHDQGFHAYVSLMEHSHIYTNIIEKATQDQGPCTSMPDDSRAVVVQIPPFSAFYILVNCTDPQDVACPCEHAS